MDSSLETLLRELGGFAEANDAEATSRSQKMLNITRHTGEFLLLLARATRASFYIKLKLSV